MLEHGSRGSIDAALMLALAFILNLGLYVLSLQLSRKFGPAYDGLQPVAGKLEAEPSLVSAWGHDWQVLPGLIDFAAHHHPKEDAEALCYIVSNYGCAAPGINFQCY
ncbi:MAG: hypothetical protein NTX25_09470 [Proteobacteria bacterium]|nr:hypothetical protein [Pseudomonadota bacterium]